MRFLRFWDVPTLFALLLSGGDLARSFICSEEPKLSNLCVFDMVGTLRIFTPTLALTKSTVKTDPVLERMMSDAVHSNREEQVERYLVGIAPTRFRALGAEKTREYTQHLMRRAKALNITSYNDIAHFGVLMQCLGSWFDRDASLPALSSILHNCINLDPAYRSDLLHKEAALFFEACHGPDQTILYTRMTELIGLIETYEWTQLGKRDLYHLLNQGYPERCVHLGLVGFDRFWAQARDAASQFNYEQEWQTSVFFAFGLFLGVGFYADPLFPWASDYLLDDSLDHEERLLEMSRYGLKRAQKIARLNRNVV